MNLQSNRDLVFPENFSCISWNSPMNMEVRYFQDYVSGNATLKFPLEIALLVAFTATYKRFETWNETSFKWEHPLSSL
jgi:hypothetical protein